MPGIVTGTRDKAINKANSPTNSPASVQLAYLQVEETENE